MRVLQYNYNWIAEDYMPWKVFVDGNKHCVHKLNEDGSKGERVACHPNPKAAERHMRALYANTDEE